MKKWRGGGLDKYNKKTDYNPTLDWNQYTLRLGVETSAQTCFSGVHITGIRNTRRNVNGWIPSLHASNDNRKLTTIKQHTTTNRKKQK